MSCGATIVEQFQTPLFNLPTEKSLDSFLERNLVLGWTSKQKVVTVAMRNVIPTPFLYLALVTPAGDMHKRLKQDLK